MGSLRLPSLLLSRVWSAVALAVWTPLGAFSTAQGPGTPTAPTELDSAHGAGPSRLPRTPSPSVAWSHHLAAILLLFLLPCPACLSPSQEGDLEFLWG